MMVLISAHDGVVEDAVTRVGGARLAETVKGLGTVTSLASCALATTGTGPMNSETWNSKARVWRTQARKRAKKAGWGPKAGRDVLALGTLSRKWVTELTQES